MESEVYHYGIRGPHHYGIRGPPLQWFEISLSNRKQCVGIGDTISEIKTIKCGVPQGSILGPIPIPIIHK